MLRELRLLRERVLLKIGEMKSAFYGSDWGYNMMDQRWLLTGMMGTRSSGGTNYTVPGWMMGGYYQGQAPAEQPKPATSTK